MMSHNSRDVRIVSWNIRSLPKRINDLIYYVTGNNIDIICLQEPFTSHTKTKSVPNIPGYYSHYCPNGNGLVTYFHHTVPHTLLSSSTDADNQFQLFQIPVNDGFIHICNTYIRGDKLKCHLLPTPRNKSIFYIGDFNARHPQLGDTRNRTTVNGNALLAFITTYDLTAKIPSQPTHLLGGYIDYSINSGVIQQNVTVDTVDDLVSDHFALLTTYTVPVDTHTSHLRPKVTIPRKYSGIYVEHLSHWFSTYTPQDVPSFYADLVAFTTKFHNYYVLKTHRRKKAPSSTRPRWTLDERLEVAKGKVSDLAQQYRRTQTSDDLFAFLTAVKTYRDLKGTVRKQDWENFLQNINGQTGLGEVWDKIKRVTKPKSSSPPHHYPAHFAEELAHQWSQQSQLTALPADIQTYLSDTHMDRQFRIEIACSEIGITDNTPITPEELRVALLQGKATSPGDDGIPYSVLRLMSQAHGNPLLCLYNMSLTAGILPAAWTASTIIPIPKPSSTKHRPISLTSCFCKAMERVLLSRLRHLIGDQLSPYLYGFTPGKSTQHCFAEYMSLSHPSSCIAFIDLKSAFDIANRDVILEQLADMGVTGQLLKWIRGYLSNRQSHVLFKGALSDTMDFHLGTPQGGVLSPTLFNILMHKLLQGISFNEHESVISYADDICILARSPTRLQSLLNDFAMSARQCGLIISTEKTRILLKNASRPHAPFYIDNHIITECRQYMYLGVNISGQASASNNLVTDLVARLQRRLRPLKLLTGKKVGVSIPIARSFYLLFIRSVIDYHALHLCNMSEHHLLPLDKFQNQAMRLILGCPTTTRIVNMRKELHIPSIPDRVRTLAATLSAKCIKQPHLAPHFTALLQNQLQPCPIQPPMTLSRDCRLVIKKASQLLTGFNTPISGPPSEPAPQPWKVVPAQIQHTQLPSGGPHSQTVLQGITLATINAVHASLPAGSLVAYSDGSLQASGGAGCGCQVYRGQDCISTTSDRLSNWTNTTLSELVGIQRAVEYLVRHSQHGLIISDSKSALNSLHSARSVHPSTVNSIKSSLIRAHGQSLTIKFLWIPAHIGLSRHDAVDRLAKLACHKPAVDVPVGLSCTTIKGVLTQRTFEDLEEERDYQRFTSVSIHHNDLFCDTPHHYGRHKTLTRHCDIVAARIRLGYRYLWQLQDNPPVSHTKCKLCDEPQKHTVQHYIIECPTIAALRPPGVQYLEFCQLLLSTDLLEDILLLHPSFASP